MHPQNHTTSTSFAARQLSNIASKERVYGLRYTLLDGSKCYYFLLVDPLKEKAFNRALNGGDAFRLEDYGRLMGQGKGEPSQELKDRISSVYNIVFN